MRDFTAGTSCVNASLSAELARVTAHSWSVSLYSGGSGGGSGGDAYESPGRVVDALLLRLEEAIHGELGLDPRLGGKWQITTYGERGGGTTGLFVVVVVVVGGVVVMLCTRIAMAAESETAWRRC